MLRICLKTGGTTARCSRRRARARARSIVDGMERLRQRTFARMARFAFTCDPPDLDPVEEVLLVHAPLVLYGVVAFVLSAQTFKMASNIVRANASQVNNMSVQASAAQTNTLVKFAVSLGRFGVAALVTLGLQVGALSLFLPTLDSFATQLSYSIDCAVDGGTSSAISFMAGTTHVCGAE